MGDNMKVSVKGQVLTIEVDLSKPGRMSKTGKSRLIASSNGAIRVPERAEEVNLNVYRKVGTDA